VVDRDHAEPLGAKRVMDAISSLEADGHQTLVFAVLGHKADIGIMALGPDLARLQAFQHELTTTPLALVDSFVSLTELSEYTATADQERDRLATEEGLSGDELGARLAAWQERTEHYQENRLHPQLPRKKLICFYPMSKRREVDAN
jgi:peroxiredoxin